MQDTPKYQISIRQRA